MATRNSAARRSVPAGSNNLRAPELDAVDRRILRVLAHDARVPNNALAEHVGIAPSTALGRPIQAMIAVRLQSHARAHLEEFAGQVAELPEVLNVFFLAGAVDFYVHIAATSTENLRTFVVVNLSGNPDVALTETNLIFEHVRGQAGQF